MKKVILGLLTVSALSITLFSCKKQTVATAPSQETIQVMPPSEGTSTEQVISVAQLAGTYDLKYSNTAANRNWVAANNVGLEFAPNSFLYTTNRLAFNGSTKKVAFSAITSGFTSNYGNFNFTLSGENLTIATSPSNVKVKVFYYGTPWLILEDLKTKIRWAFAKK